MHQWLTKFRLWADSRCCALTRQFSRYGGFTWSLPKTSSFPSKSRPTGEPPSIRLATQSRPSCPRGNVLSRAIALAATEAPATAAAAPATTTTPRTRLTSADRRRRPARAVGWCLFAARDSVFRIEVDRPPAGVWTPACCHCCRGGALWDGRRSMSASE
jgi:hypothetical protein